MNLELLFSKAEQSRAEQRRDRWNEGNAVATGYKQAQYMLRGSVFIAELPTSSLGNWVEVMSFMWSVHWTGLHKKTAF